MTQYRYMNRGFSLIEILVSVALFSVVVIAGTASILAAIDANQKSQSLNSVMTNLNTALESMAREIRLGSDFNCIDGSDTDCISLEFVPDVGDDIIYSFSIDEETGVGSIKRKVGNLLAQDITAGEVKVTGGHFVIVSDTTAQDKVFITVQGYAESQAKTRSDFYIQTLMSKRDISAATQ